MAPDVVKDVMSEWVRLDAQRGGKLLSLVAVFWFGVAVVAIGVAVVRSPG